MKDGARFFAYITWVLMLSLAIILLSNPFLSFITNPEWTGLVALLALGFLYLNLTYASVKRYISKVPELTNLHYVLSVVIYIPTFVWVWYFSDTIEGARLITVAVLAVAVVLGTIYGTKSGIKARYHYIQKIKEEQ